MLVHLSFDVSEDSQFPLHPSLAIFPSFNLQQPVGLFDNKGKGVGEVVLKVFES